MEDLADDTPPPTVPEGLIAETIRSEWKSARAGGGGGGFGSAAPKAVTLKLSKEAATLASELITAFIEDARRMAQDEAHADADDAGGGADAERSRQGGGVKLEIESEHLERILPQLLLDY